MGRESKASRLATKSVSETKGSDPSSDIMKQSDQKAAPVSTIPARKKTGGLMGFTKSSSMTQGPRMKRLLRLRESGVLDMQEDKAVVLNILPLTPYDVSCLRALI